MIDRIVAAKSRHEDRLIDPNYKPEDAIRRKTLTNAHSDRIAIIFPWWRGGGAPYRFLVKRLTKKGWAVLAYDFHNQILEADDDMVVKSFEHIKTKITDDIHSLVSRYGYKEVQLIGISIGTVPLTMVADSYPDFTGATLVVGGDDLAVDMWHGGRTQNYREAFEDEGVGVKKLDKDWEDVAPKNHIKHFAGKRTKIIVSSNDRFILSKYQNRLANDVARAGGIVSIKRTRLGHAMSIVRFCLFGNP